MARPSKWTQQLQEAICRLVEVGDAAEVAAGVNGIGRSTHFEWLARNEDYRTAIARARDVFESNTRAVAMAGDEQGVGFGPAKVALEVLGRRVPSRWSPRVKHEIDESNRLMMEALTRVCADPEVYARVREAGDLSAVLVSVCTELSRLDGEGDAAEGSSDVGSAAPIH